MDKNKIIKRLTVFSSMIPLLFILNSSSINKNNKNVFSTNFTKKSIKYNYGTIYIGNKEYLDSIDNLGSKDILVLDNRNNTDPNLKIYNSFRITNPTIQEEIIDCLLYYEKLFPSRWNRSKNSLINEWIIHNYMYYFGYQKHRTTDVDLNNDDEKMYVLRKNLLE